MGDFLFCHVFQIGDSFVIYNNASTKQISVYLQSQITMNIYIYIYVYVYNNQFGEKHVYVAAVRL